MMMEPRIEVGNAWLDNRMTWNTWVIGRLKPGVTPAQTEADLNTIAAELILQYPRENDRLHFRLSKPGLIGDLVGGPAKAFTFGLLLLAALVLLAACTNLASMLTARATDRQREFAIRLAIGADRRSEEHTSELQSLAYLVCRLLLEKKKKIIINPTKQKKKKKKKT